MDDLPDVLTALTALGGVARRGALVSACGRTAVDAAVRGGVILPVARGTWTSALEFDRARAEALALRAVLAYRSAALDRGWAVWTTPDRPEVIVPKSRRVSSERRRAVSLHRTDPRPMTSTVIGPAPTAPCSTACGPCPSPTPSRSPTRRCVLE